MKVYLVGAYCGSYSTEDYTEWVVRGFFEEDNAVKEVNKLNQQIADIKPEYKRLNIDWTVYDKIRFEDFLTRAYELYKRVDDPFLSEKDDVDTKYYYFAVEVT